MLTAAAPAAFGFLAVKPADISLIGTVSNGSLVPSILQVPDGKVLSVVGGNVQLIGAVLAAPSGRVNIVAIAAPGDVHLDPSNPVSSVDISASPVLANVAMLDSQVVTDANAAGSMVVRAADLSMDLGSGIIAGTADGPGDLWTWD